MEEDKSYSSEKLISFPCSRADTHFPCSRRREAAEETLKLRSAALPGRRFHPRLVLVPGPGPPKYFPGAQFIRCDAMKRFKEEGEEEEDGEDRLKEGILNRK